MTNNINTERNDHSIFFLISSCIYKPFCALEMKDVQVCQIPVPLADVRVAWARFALDKQPIPVSPVYANAATTRSAK